MFHLILIAFLSISQTEAVAFELVNGSSETIKIEIPGFRTVLLPTNQPIEMSFHPDQQVFALKDIDGDGVEERLLLFVVGQDHSGKSLKVDKLLKAAQKKYMAQSDH
jgi:hypothetical protein